ncbi:RNA polymerase II degradation factor 1-like, partial [Bombus pyrosoma]|uniref:RNA polymerase II degradation factor 1-like n=1 Tax=Bombus pyrosoma TaxID=396416 RepID=UPI001CB91219
MGDKGDKGHEQGTDQDERSKGSETPVPMYQVFPKEKAPYTVQEALNIKPLEYDKPLTTSDIKLKNMVPDVDVRTQSPLKMFFDEDPNYRPPSVSQLEPESEFEFELRHGSPAQDKHVIFTESQLQFQPQLQYPYQHPPQYQPQLPYSYSPVQQPQPLYPYPPQPPSQPPSQSPSQPPSEPPSQ